MSTSKTYTFFTILFLFGLYLFQNIRYSQEDRTPATSKMEIIKGNDQFVQNLTFEPLIDFKENHCGS